MITYLLFRSKDFVRSINSINTDQDQINEAAQVIRTADRVTNLCEALLNKSNSIYQAQLLNAKADQVITVIL